MKFSAVLLAGGESRRMGQDKTMMLFRDRPLWQHQLETLRQISPHEIFIAARTDPAWRPAEVEFVADAQPSRGPLSGIAAALSRTTNDHLLVVGIDMPFMAADYLRELCEKARNGVGVVPLIEDRLEPLAAIYPRGAGVDFASALNGDDFSLQFVVRKLITLGKMQAITVSAEDNLLFRNLNEPADLD